jgi:hypothetical protein
MSQHTSRRYPPPSPGPSQREPFGDGCREEGYSCRNASGSGNLGDVPRIVLTPSGHSQLRPWIAPSRISRKEYGHLLEDLQRLTYDIVFALEVARGGDPVELRSSLQYRSPLDEIDHIQRVLIGVEGRPGLEKILRRIATDPHKTLHLVEEVRPSWRANRPSPKVVRWLVRNHEFWGPTTEGKVFTGGVTLAGQRFSPTHLLASAKQASYDTHENRVVKLFLRLMRIRLARAFAIAETSATSLPEDVQDLPKKVTALGLLCATFLENVSLQRHLTLQPTMVLSREPRYKAVYRSYTWIS